jgi:GNAT superfamily N-acetyltransferase
MSGIIVRRWTAENRLDEIMAMVHQAFAAFTPPSGVLTETVADLAERQRDGVVLVALEGDTFVGSVFGVRKDDGLYLSRMAVLPAYRKRGVGRALIGAAENEARRAGLVRLTLRVRQSLPGNLAYFASLGFERTGEGQDPGRSPYYVMQGPMLTRDGGRAG